MIEPQKIVTISTAHISRNSAEYLDQLATGNVSSSYPIVYSKDSYGWFILIPEEENYVINDVPEDIAACMLFARKMGCSWLCMDGDGESTDELPTYDWFEDE